MDKYIVIVKLKESTLDVVEPNHTLESAEERMEELWTVHPTAWSIEARKQ